MSREASFISSFFLARSIIICRRTARKIDRVSSADETRGKQSGREVSSRRVACETTRSRYPK